MEPVPDDVPIENAPQRINLNSALPFLISSKNPKRLMLDIRTYLRDFHESDGLVLEFADDLKTVKGYIQVLDEDSPYYGGCFVVEAAIPENYPFEPPKIRFLTKIWHPHVDTLSGNFCIGDSWSAYYTFRTLFLAVQIAIANPEAEDPLQLAIGKQMVENPEVFKKTAQFWTKKYARETEGSVDEEYETLIKKRMEDTGDDEDSVILDMSFRGWAVAEDTDDTLGDAILTRNTSATM